MNEVDNIWGGWWEVLMFRQPIWRSSSSAQKVSQVIDTSVTELDSALNSVPESNRRLKDRGDCLMDISVLLVNWKELKVSMNISRSLLSSPDDVDKHIIQYLMDNNFILLESDIQINGIKWKKSNSNKLQIAG